MLHTPHPGQSFLVEDVLQSHINTKLLAVQSEMVSDGPCVSISTASMT